MKSIYKLLGKSRAAFARGLEKLNAPRPQPITLSMIATELENDLTELRSRFVKGITKVFGIRRK